MLADAAGASPLSDRECRRIAADAYNHHHASQKIDELAAVIQRIGKVESIAEIGCDAGGTLYAWSRIAERVYGITLPDNSRETGGQGYPLQTHGADVFIGNSHSQEAVDWLTERSPIDVLHIDGDHSYEGVKRDFELYSPLARMVVIHDAANYHDPRVDVPRFCADIGITDFIIGAGRSLGFGIWTKEPHGH